ncbi:MAG: roadblock/LC7 domain-containing protein [Deltaproteobacteria bacterium]|nr:roadblock/LC7 domain-containing protein [Deltaproteobacteria bacterium]
MSFTAILKDLAARTGAIGAVLLDWEGELIASYSGSPQMELDLIGAHHGIILDIARDAALRQTGQSAGDVTSISITTNTGRLVISTIKEGYYVIAALPRSVSIARCAFEVKKAVPLIEKEMG